MDSWCSSTTRPTAPGAAPKSDIINEETGAISFGDGKDEVDTFVDFMCPICGDFEKQYGEQLQAAARRWQESR